MKQEKDGLKKRNHFQLNFFELNPNMDQFEKAISKGEFFDNVCCFNGMQFCFEDKDKAYKFFENVASVFLKSGGYFFFGILPDSSSIWYKAQKVILGRTDKTLSIKGELYTIQFPNEDFNYFGTKYIMKMEGNVEQEEYLVHFPTLVSIAESVGLSMLEISNLTEFYEDHRKNYGELLKSLGVLNKQGKIEPQQKDLIGLFTTFCFQKVDKTA